MFLSDVTERRRAREALQESEARMKGIASNVPGMVFRLERPRAGAFPTSPISARAARRWSATALAN